MFTQEQFENIREALRHYDGVNGYEMNSILDVAIQYTKKPKYRMKTVEELIAEGYRVRQTNLATYLNKGVWSVNLLEVVGNQIGKNTFKTRHDAEIYVEVTE